MIDLNIHSKFLDGSIFVTPRVWIFQFLKY